MASLPDPYTKEVQQFESQRNMVMKLQDIEEEEGDLFEINLEIVNKIPPPHYWEGCVTAAATSALLANCLLPIADVSSAVPMVISACDALRPPPPTKDLQPAGAFVLQSKV